MSTKNRVIWSDGLFVKPQHFQQQARFVDAVVNSRVAAIEEHFYGFTSLTIDAARAHLGKIAIIQAEGVFPDGTPFSIPNDDMQPPPLELRKSFAASDVIYLCLPDPVDGAAEAGDDAYKGGGRLAARSIAVRDNAVETGALTEIKVGAVRPVLMAGSQDTSAYSKLAVCHVVGRQAEGSVVLNDAFLPTMLSVSCSRTLRRFVSEFSETLRRRAEVIAQRIGGPGQNGVADVSDFLLLQTLNRVVPLLQHFDRRARIHPRDLYETLIQIAGELSTFMLHERIPPQFAPYNHESPELCFPPLIGALRGLLAQEMEPTSSPIPVQRKKHGFMIAPLNDAGFINDREFVLAVSARMSADRLQKEFPPQAKVSSIDGIRELVSRSLRGVPLIPLPVAPRQLPYHAGFSYFQLDKQSPHWRALEGASGFGFHFADSFPELDVQFWAIRK